MNYYEHHLGDYLRDTAALSMVEDGAYRRLIDAYYIAEEPFPDDKRELMKTARANTKAERDAVEYVLKKFFVYEAGSGWAHKRCEVEIRRYKAKQDKARASAEARWSASKTHSERNANASPEQDAQDMRTHSERNANGMHRAPVPSPQSPVTREEISNLTVAPARPPDDRLPGPAALTLVDPTPSAKSAPPDCPHRDVLALWAEVLPALPQHLPSQWRGTRADHLRARWRETAVAKGWADQAQGIAYLRRFFGYVGQSAFLTGRTPPAAGKRPFAIELEWLVKPSNWAKVHEGKYHSEAA